MSVQFCGCFCLSMKKGQANTLQAFFKQFKLDFLSSCWESEFTNDNRLKDKVTTQRNNDSYFQACWVEGVNINAEFGGDDFVLNLKTFCYRGERYAFISVTERSLMWLTEHLNDLDCDFLEFLIEFESVLTSSCGVIGEDISVSDLLDFLDGKLPDTEINESIRIVSCPNAKNNTTVRTMGFKERILRQRNYFYRKFPPADDL